MPFDPNLPQENTLADAAQMRGQLNALKALIDANPGIDSVVIDSVSTVGPGEAATVTASVTGTVLHLSFAFPRGNDGVQGEQGQQGPPFANAVIDSVTTLNSGESATVSVSFDGSSVHLSFGIPRGTDGAPGAPGEVTAAALAAQIAGTSANSNGVALLDIIINDPPTQAQLMAVMAKVNELITALRR